MSFFKLRLYGPKETGGVLVKAQKVVSGLWAMRSLATVAYTYVLKSH